MKLPRRTFLHLAAGAAALPMAPRIAWAQTYPSRPVRIVVGAPAGGANDTVARLIGQWLLERLGQPFVVENRPGATGKIATEDVVRAPPDGYTLLMVATSAAVSASLYKLSYDFIRDITAVASISRVPNVMEVNPSSPAKTVSDFIAYAKANSGKVNLGSGGIGGSGHMSGELFMMMTGVKMVHVPYRGGAPALSDLLGGQVDVMFDQLISSIGYITARRLRALGVTTATRVEILRDIPTVGEVVPGYEASAWYGIGAPRNTPAEIIAKLNNEINAGLADPKIKARLADLGGTALPGSPTDFGKLIVDETEKWAKVIKFAGIKAD
jgi:tripartite-type tricarboxylate transporter receptor subunit TctC